MSQDLTTRDVFYQIDARLGRVEDDVRGLRVEMNGRFDSIDQRFDRLHAMFVSLMIGIGGLVIAVGGLWFKL
jgi:hypothetical protein